MHGIIEKIAFYKNTFVTPIDLIKSEKAVDERKVNIGWCSFFPPIENGAAAVTYYHFKELQKDKRINLFAIPLHGRINKNLFPGVRFARIEADFLDAVIFFGLGEVFEKNARKTKVKKIAWQTMHSTPKEEESEKLLFEQLKTADKSIMISKWAMETYREEGLKETQYVPHGVDLKLFMKKKAGNKVLFVSRGEYKKGVIPFLECAEEVLSKNRNIVFELIASTDKNSPFLGEMETKIDELKKRFPENFFFEKKWIEYEKIVEKYCDAFVLVFPSNNEGFGVPLIEAMACGIPSITFDKQPMNEIVLNNKTGFCIESDKKSAGKYHGYLFPDKSKMAEKVLKLFEDKALLRKMSNNCMKHVKKNYSIRKVAKKLVDITLKELIVEHFCKICGKKTFEGQLCKEHNKGFSAKEFNKIFSESSYEGKNPVFLSIFSGNKLRRRINQFINRREHYLFGFLRNKIGNNSKVLDFGCGHGFWTFDLKKEFGSNVFAFDISKKAVKYAKEKTEEKGEKIFFCVADACQLPFKDNSFDAVISQDVLGHLYAPEKGLSECHRVIKSKGVFSLHSETSEYRKRRFHKKIIEKLSQDPWVFDAGHIGIMPKKILENKIRKIGFIIEKEISPSQRFGFLLNTGDFYDRGLKYLKPNKFSQLWFLKKYHNMLKRILTIPPIAKAFFAANALIEYIETKVTSKDGGGSIYFLLQKKIQRSAKK